MFCVLVSSVLNAQISSFTSSTIKDYRSKVDTLPYFTFLLTELDTLIGSLKHVPGSVELYGINCETEIGFRVDKHNKITFSGLQKAETVIPEGLKLKDKNGGDMIRATFVDSVKNECIQDAEKLMALTEGLWVSDSLRSEREMVIKIPYHAIAFERLNKQPKGTAPFVQLGTLFVPKDAALPYNLGVRKMATNKNLLARIYLERAIMWNRKDIDAYYNLGICNLKLKRQKEACWCWHKCQELGDNSVSEQISKYCK